jgi:class 3 adenylate cyclase
MQSWRSRCDALLAKPTEVHYATTEPFWGDRVLFEWVNTVTQGLALTHAARLGMKVYALVVLDRDAVPAGAMGAPSTSATPATTPVGGTAYFLEQWQAGGREAHVINLAELRARVKAEPSAHPGPSAPAPVTVRPGVMPRQVKAMLFADVKNYSKLSDAQAPSFLATFRHEVARVLAASQSPPEFRNTWGDGLYLVFGSVRACADFALRLLERMGEMDWASLGLPADTAVRMGMHAGPVYPMWDEIIERQNFFGSHVNRAARIEPVTTPGAAFTIAEFAAAITVASRHDFLCEFVGVEWLFKEYDRCALYRLARR